MIKLEEEEENRIRVPLVGDRFVVQVDKKEEPKPEEPDFNSGLEDESRAGKGGMVLESSPADHSDGVMGVGGRPGADEGKLGSRTEDGVALDPRLLYTLDAQRFRCELRVGTSFEKFQLPGSEQGGGGGRVGCSATTSGLGVDGVSISSLFDDDGLQPPHLQAAMQGQGYVEQTEAVGDRCDSDESVYKAIPDPLPEFQLPEDRAGETEVKSGVSEDEKMPVRKAKGKRDARGGHEIVEMICTPVGASEEEREDPAKLRQALGLSSLLWEEEEERGVKTDATMDGEGLREARVSRVVQEPDRFKGRSIPQVETASFTDMERGFGDGPAVEQHKTLGGNAASWRQREREATSEEVVKLAEWAFDEYLRKLREDPPPVPVPPKPDAQPLAEPSATNFGGGKAEVVDIKFDTALGSAEEREAFGEEQRRNLAKVLNIPEDHIQVVHVRPGSPLTLVRFQVAPPTSGQLPPLPEQRPATPEDAFGAQPVGVEVMGGGEAEWHGDLTQRMQAAMAGTAVHDTALQLEHTAPETALAARGYEKVQTQAGRGDEGARCKGDKNDADPDLWKENASQEPTPSGEDDTGGFAGEGKDKGPVVSADPDVVERAYKPGRDLMSETQYGSACVQRRAGGPGKRLVEDRPALSGDGQEEKVAFVEVEDTKRRKEAEDEVRFLPAQRGDVGQRTSVVLRKEEGEEDERYQRLEEHDRRREEKDKDEPCKLPSLNLNKVLEEDGSVLAPKVTGQESQRTAIPCEPGPLEMNDRRGKKKGKHQDKLRISAIPEAYSAFGFEGQSQRLVPSVVTMEVPGKAPGKGKEEGGEAASPEKPGLEMGDGGGAPDLLVMKFDVSFVDDEARQAFAEQQRRQLAALLRIPPEALAVRLAAPGSPITVVTFEVESGMLRRVPKGGGGGQPGESRRLDAPVLEVGVMTYDDEYAEEMMGVVRQLVGPACPVSRMSTVPGKGKELKDRKVQFKSGKEAKEPVPAYLRKRDELEHAERRGGPLVSDKESVELGADGEEGRGRQGKGGMPLGESELKDGAPIAAYDRRLPKHAKSKQHLLSRIHTIESTLQRLYGKLEADHELPDIETIEKIMSNTIKQSVLTPDQPKDPSLPAGHEDEEEAGAAAAPQREPQPPPRGEVAGATEESEADKQAKREALRAERRARMQHREEERAQGAGKAEAETPGDGFSTRPSVGFAEDLGEAAAAEEEERGAEEEEPARTKKQQRAEQDWEEKEAALNRMRAIQEDEGWGGGDHDAAAPPDSMAPSPVKGGWDDRDASPHSPLRSPLKGIPEHSPPPSRGGHSRSPTEDHGAPDLASRAGLESPGFDRLASDEKPRRRKKHEMAEGVEGEGGMSGPSQGDWKQVFSKVRHNKKNEVVEALEGGCPIEVKDDNGNSMLNVAAQNGHKAVIKALLRRGANIDTQNKKGHTPLHFCFTYGFTDLGNYLISKGANDTLTNLAGLTCYEGLGD